MLTDLRFSIRALLKTPGFTIVALLTLALGIGLNTSMYTLVNVLLFRNAPFPEPERLVNIAGNSPQAQNEGFSFVEVEELRRQATAAADASSGGASAHTLESLTTYSGWNNTLAEPGQPAERLASIDASAEFFATFRVQPMLGRAFTADEEVPGRNEVALLSYALWQSRFGRDPAIVGRTLRLNAEQVTVIGVMPPDFAYPLLWGKVDVLRPITIPRHIVNDRNNRFFGAIGRMRPGASPQQVQAELAPVVASWAKDYPQHSKDRSLFVQLLGESVVTGSIRGIVWMLLGLSSFVLLIACANLANLELARATANVRDLAIRSALGASRRQLIVHQMIESLLLALAGGALGVLVAAWVNGVLSRAIAPPQVDRLPLPMDLPVILGALGMSVLTGVLFGLLPAWLASRPNVVTALKQQSRGSTSSRGAQFARQALIVGEVALALTLLGGAGVMIRGFQSFLKQDNGWDTGRVLGAIIHLPEQSTYDTEDKRRVAIDKLVRRLAQISGAEKTAVCTGLPLFGYSASRSIQIEGQMAEDPSKQPLAGYNMVSSDYFAAMGIPIREGRDFSPDLRADSPPVVIVNETLARKFWPGQSALGKRIADQQGDKTVWREVIGVVRDIQFAVNGGRPDTVYQVYKPLVHEPWGYLNLVVRGAAPGTFKNQLQQVVRDVDSDVAVQFTFTIPEAVSLFQGYLLVINNTLVCFALLGLVLAAVGLYGVISHLVAQRTGEFGIRLALGAKPGDVLALVLGRGALLTGIGLAIGSVLAYLLNLFLGSLMPRIAGSDPMTLLLVALILLAVALLACFVPARSATRINPLDALRAE